MEKPPLPLPTGPPLPEPPLLLLFAGDMPRTIHVAGSHALGTRRRPFHRSQVPLLAGVVITGASLPRHSCSSALLHQTLPRMISPYLRLNETTSPRHEIAHTPRRELSPKSAHASTQPHDRASEYPNSSPLAPTFVTSSSTPYIRAFQSSASQ